MSSSIDNSSVEENASLLHGQSVHGRKISWTSAYVLIISRMTGSGIFAAPGVVVQSAGSIGLSILIWLVGVMLAACAATVAMEYGCMLPRSGGQNLYLEYTYRRPKYLVMSVLSVQVFLQTFTANNCIVFGEYLQEALPVDFGPGAPKAAALGLLTFTAVIHGVFAPLGVKIQNCLGFLKIGMMVLLMGIALFAVAGGRLDRGDLPHRGSTNKDIWQGSDWRWHSTSQGLLRVYYAYAGVDNANMVLNEVRDPVGMLRVVVPLALATIFAVYLLVNLAFFLVLPVDIIKGSGELVGHEFFVRLFGPGDGARVFSLLISCCIAGNVMVGVFSLARQNQEIARRGFYPRLFASSRPFNAPLGGVILNFIPAGLIILAVPSSHVYSFMLDIEGYPAQISAFAIATGLLWLRWTRPQLPRPFKASIPMVVVYLTICASQVISPFLPSSTTSSGVWEGKYALVGLAMWALQFLYLTSNLPFG